MIWTASCREQGTVLVGEGMTSHEPYSKVAVFLLRAYADMLPLRLDALRCPRHTAPRSHYPSQLSCS